MFGGPPPQLSSAEIKAQENEATMTIQTVLVGAFLLYMSPFAVDFAKKVSGM